MAYFEFSKKVLDRVIEQLEKAQKFIRIAMFQIHHKDVFDVLKNRLKDGVKVELFTLPFDSINQDIKEGVIRLFHDLERNGAKIYFCKWNIGDPERTTTAVGRWYSFHGKFIITDKSVIALSANFTQQKELDAIIIFQGDVEKIEEFNSKFDHLLELFYNDRSGYNGTIRQKILNSDIPNPLSLFELPRVIETNVHKNYWIQDYPSTLCPENTSISDRLYVCPFDVRGRNLIMNLISEANEFAFISTESFTDPEFSDFLIKSKLRELDVRILTGTASMDFSDRMQRMLRELLSNNIQLRTIEENLHAKLIITDKRVVISSINLNKMNLGFSRTSQLWRENTETLYVCSNVETLSRAKTQYLDMFDKSIDISVILAQKIESQIGKMFTSLFGLRSKREVKVLFARLILHQEIQVKKLVMKIGKITTRLMNFYNRSIVNKNDFLMSLILHYLSERKHDFDQLEDRLKILGVSFNLINLLNELQLNKFIEKEGDFYKIRLESLF